MLRTVEHALSRLVSKVASSIRYFEKKNKSILASIIYQFFFWNFRMCVVYYEKRGNTYATRA